MIKRGEIVLANLNPKRGNEIGKWRPVLIIQTDMLNEVLHPTVVILPLSTKLIDDAAPLRFRLTKRQKLKQDSDVLCDQIRSIDIQRIKSDGIANVAEDELKQIEEQVRIILGFE